MIAKLTAAILLITLSLGAFPALAQNDALSKIRELSSNGQYAAALEQLETYLGEQPDNVEGLLFKGVLLTKSGKPDEAITVFQRLAREHPELPEPHNNLAVLYAGQSRLEEARLSLGEAIRLQPRYDTAHENLGDIHAKLAILSYQRAGELNEQNSRAMGKAKLIERVFQKPDAGDQTPAAQPNKEQIDEPAKVTSASPPGCYSVGAVPSGATATAIADWFETRGVQAKVIQGEGSTTQFQVYAGPFQNADAANVLVEQILAAGVDDVLRISKGELANGVSLGVYSKEATAQRRLDEIKQLGFEANLRPRQFGSSDAFTVEVVSAANTKNYASEFAGEFPEYSLRDKPCP